MFSNFLGDKYPLIELIRCYWLIFPVAFTVGLIGTTLCRKVALRYGVVDRPDGKVKTHAEPTAYLGGVGILCGVIAGLAIGLWLLTTNRTHISPEVLGHSAGFGDQLQSWRILVGIGLGGIIACLVGVLDDILDLQPWQKLLGQTLAAAVLFLSGVYPRITHLFGMMHIDLDPVWNLWIGGPMVLFFILGATNSLNLLDGLDGLCAGVTAIITTAFLLLALGLATWAYSINGDPVRLIVCLALVGGTMGFFPLNRHPAKIFMGDAGSMLLGFIAGTLMILFTESFGRWSIAAIVIFFLPILDTAVALVRRYLNQRPLFVSDRGHIYDQLMDRGHSLKNAVKISYILAMLYALVGLVIATTRFRYALIAFIILIIVSGLVVWRKGFLKTDPAPAAEHHDSE